MADLYVDVVAEIQINGHVASTCCGFCRRTALQVVEWVFLSDGRISTRPCHLQLLGRSPCVSVACTHVPHRPFATPAGLDAGQRPLCRDAQPACLLFLVALLARLGPAVFPLEFQVLPTHLAKQGDHTVL